MSFTAKDVMTLRERTGVGMMDCKKALTETNGDMDKAIDYLREKGIATAAKKAGRIASEGIVYALKKGKVGVLVEVNCESDFVAKGEVFKGFVDSVANYIADNDVKTLEEVVSAKEEERVAAVAKCGEKIDIRRFEKYTTADGVIETYIHMGGKIGIMLEATVGSSESVLHDVALQIAASKPSYVTRDQVDPAELEKEKEILAAQALNEGKPQAIIDKMVQGRINKFYKEVCLMEQEFVKDNTLTIAGYLKANGDSQIVRFARFEMGEGLQKKQDDFVKEIKDQVAKVN